MRGWGTCVPSEPRSHDRGHLLPSPGPDWVRLTLATASAGAVSGDGGLPQRWTARSLGGVHANRTDRAGCGAGSTPPGSEESGGRKPQGQPTDILGEITREIGSMREQGPGKPGGPSGPSRRDFLRGSGVAAATAVLTGQATLALDEAEAAVQEGPKVLSGTVDVTLKVNGEDRACQIEPRSTLLDMLRHQLDVTGPKRVCDRGKLRGVHDHHRRRPGLLVHHAGGLLPGQDDRDAREFRHGGKRRSPRLPPERRAHVRVLHAGVRDSVQGAAGQESEPDDGRGSQGARGQYLPVRDVHRRDAMRPWPRPKP